MEGLTQSQVKERLSVYGKNEIKQFNKLNPLKIFLQQFVSPVILILIAAATILYFLNIFDPSSANFSEILLILSIVFFSGFFGFIQDYKAERSIEALKKLSTPTAIVVRDGKQVEISSNNLVPGDVLVLEEGNIIQADAEILEGELDIDESILTGESRAVKKKKEDKIYSGCSILTGRAKAVVTHTGMRTKIGKLAKKMQEIKEDKTPFQKQMDTFCKKISLYTVLLVIVIFLVGYIKFGLLDSFLFAVSLAIAAIPEGLPAVITLSLSFGAKEMVRKKALIRKLGITESIGTVNIICSDKTGTITEGKMKVREFFFDKEIKANEMGNKMALRIVNFCNNAKKVFRKGKEIFVGDETEIALKEFSKGKINEKFQRIDEIPFSSRRKMMSVIGKVNGKKYVLTKGAPEVLIERCNRYLKNGKIVKLTFKKKVDLLYKNQELAKKGRRVLALAYKEQPKSEKLFEKNLVWVGLVSLADPPREEVKGAIEECRNAGIRVIMVTGDHPDTALTVANEVGIESRKVITGTEVEKMDDMQLKKELEFVNVFARADPVHKLRILRILQRGGNIVAMTGDGVNDALALKKADVGIAMGIKGTEVAKQASDIVLMDDNFATIKSAVAEGRRIFNNIRKFVNYLFSCNFAEVSVILLATLFFALKDPILLPFQILWINLLTDGMPAIALGLDPATKNLMKKKPRGRCEPIIDSTLKKFIGLTGVSMSILLVAVFLLLLPMGEVIARTALFTGFILFEFSRIGMIRYQEKMSFFANRWLVMALSISMMLQLIILYTSLNIIFKVVPLGLHEWGIILGGMFLNLIAGILISRFVINRPFS